MSLVKFITTNEQNINNQLGNIITDGSLVVTEKNLYIAMEREGDLKKQIIGGTTENIQVVGVEIGNLKNGDIIPANLNLNDVLKLIFQKEDRPTYTQPVITLNSQMDGTPAGAYEMGSTITPKFNTLFIKNDAGDMLYIRLYKNNVEVASTTDIQYQYNENPFILQVDTEYIAEVSYQEGPIKNTNLGNPFPLGRIEAGVKRSIPIKFLARRPLFYGSGLNLNQDVNSIKSLSGKIDNPTAGVIFNKILNVGENMFMIAYPATIRDISKIKYMEMNDENIVSLLTKTIVRIPDARGGNNNLIDYKVFVFKMLVPAEAIMTFNITL